MCSRTHVPAPPPCLLTSRPFLQLAMLTIRTRTTRHCSTRKNNTSSSHLHLTSSPPDHGAIYERTLCALGRGSEPWQRAQRLLNRTILEAHESLRIAFQLACTILSPLPRCFGSHHLQPASILTAPQGRNKNYGQNVGPKRPCFPIIS